MKKLYTTGFKGRCNLCGLDIVVEHMAAPRDAEQAAVWELQASLLHGAMARSHRDTTGHEYMLLPVQQVAEPAP